MNVFCMNKKEGEFIYSCIYMTFEGGVKCCIESTTHVHLKGIISVTNNDYFNELLAYFTTKKLRFSVSDER